jgi:hypothetical protein
MTRHVREGLAMELTGKRAAMLVENPYEDLEL